MKNPGQDKPRLSVVEEVPDELSRILLVDSDDTETFQLRRAFDASRKARLGYAPDTETAARMVAAERWDLIAVDPVLDGRFALLSHLKDNHRRLATVAVTRQQSPQFMRQAVNG